MPEVPSRDSARPRYLRFQCVQFRQGTSGAVCARPPGPVLGSALGPTLRSPQWSRPPQGPKVNLPMTQGPLQCLIGVPIASVALCDQLILGPAVKLIPRRPHLLPGVRTIAPRCPGTARKARGTQESSRPSSEENSGASRPSIVRVAGPSQASSSAATRGTAHHPPVLLGPSRPVSPAAPGDISSPSIGGSQGRSLRANPKLKSTASNPLWASTAPLRNSPPGGSQSPEVRSAARPQPQPCPVCGTHGDGTRVGLVFADK
ncbi:hypothetical protein NDU88_005517 [Pleurodeles waltl]|uniref:Uncharacterized protein n=1 Tax=Pleurodeles waltl TaxID=8319 RepID=A0AAV7TBK9_PLEWA|nr:hypothetical protein NDU88_005517 [Pleurodeles waltl]